MHELGEPRSISNSGGHFGKRRYWSHAPLSMATILIGPSAHEVTPAHDRTTQAQLATFNKKAVLKAAATRSVTDIPRRKHNKFFLQAFALALAFEKTFRWNNETRRLTFIVEEDKRTCADFPSM